MILFISIFGFISLFFLVNKYILFRSKRHSNTFVKKILHKIRLKKYIRTTQQGWNIKTLETSLPITSFDSLNLPLKNWFSLPFEDCSGVADPFLVKSKDDYFLFFEYEFHKHLKKGADLAYASSKNGIDWNYEGKILTEPFHQSFPYVFLYNQTYYLLPESFESNEVRLYKAIDFPKKWELDTVLYSGKPFVDTVFLQKEGVYYWFTTDLTNNQLCLFYSESFKGEWCLHPSSPIASDFINNRNAGSLIVEEGVTYRVAQDGRFGYGSGVNLYQIVQIDKANYFEKAIKEPLLFKDFGVKKDAIHHLSIINNADKRLIAVDAANFAINGLTIIRKNK